MASQFFPRRKPREPVLHIDHFCHWDEAAKHHLVCPEFFFAHKSKAIVIDPYLGSWVLEDGPVRTMDWKAKYYAEERNQNYTDHSDEKYQIHDCCFCGGETISVYDPAVCSE